MQEHPERPESNKQHNDDVYIGVEESKRYVTYACTCLREDRRTVDRQR